MDEMKDLATPNFEIVDHEEEMRKNCILSQISFHEDYKDDNDQYLSNLSNVDEDEFQIHQHNEDYFNYGIMEEEKDFNR